MRIRAARQAHAAAILKDVDASLVEVAETYRPSSPPSWGRDVEPLRAELVAYPAIEATIAEAGRSFAEALVVAGAPVAVPTAMTAFARGQPPDEVEDEEEAPRERLRKAERSRYGPTLGSTVHRTIELALTGARGTIDDIVHRAAAEHGLVERLAEAAADAARGLAAMQALGGGEIQTEYPVCMAGQGGTLLVGFIDLLAVRDGEVVVLDFKTDAPPPAGTSIAAYPDYRRQLELYVEALRASGLLDGRGVRAGLVFTGSGEVLWA